MATQNTLTCICIDDEPLAREGLKLALTPHKELSLIAAYANAKDALEHSGPSPDVIFVDIEMPQMSGFEMVKHWPSPMPIVIFVTAYDQYALKAFEHNALDYVLKPINEEQFARVVEKIIVQYKNRGQTSALLNKINALESQLQDKSPQISLKTDEGYFRTELRNILWLESVQDHVCVQLTERQLIVRSTLKKFLSELIDHNFFQIHRSFVVNAAHVIKVSSVGFGDYEVLMSNEKTLRMSRRYKKLLKVFGKK